MDLVIIDIFTICNNITLYSIKIETDRLYILSNYRLVALSRLDLTLTMVSARLVVLLQSWLKIACGQGVFDHK